MKTSYLIALVMLLAAPKLVLGDPAADLLRAAKSGDADSRTLIASMLENKTVGPNIRDKDGNTALIIAATYGNTATVDILIKHGADLNLSNAKGETALTVAMRPHQPGILTTDGEGNIIEQTPEKTLTLLLDSGARVDLKDRSGQTLLFFAPPEYIPLLVSHNADPNAKNNSGDTPLLSALSAARYDRAVALLQNGADPNIVSLSRVSPLLMLMGLSGAYYTYDEPRAVFEKLIEMHANVNATDSRGRTALIINGSFASALLENGADPNAQDNQGNTALLNAVDKGDIETVALLLQHGANANQASPLKTPLTLATERKERTQLVPMLLEAGAKLDSTDKDGKNVLSHLCSARFQAGDSELVQSLVALGLDVNKRDKQGRTALFYCSSIEMMQALLDNGANVNAVDNGGNTVLSLRTNDADVIAFLLERSADANIAAKNGVTPLMNRPGVATARLLVEAGVKLDVLDHTKMSALSYAMDHGDLDLAQYFLDNNASVKAVNSSGETLLHTLIKHNHGNARVVEFAGYLLEHGVSVNAVDANGRTALSYAVDNPDSLAAQCATLLIQHGADVNIKDKRGKRALSYLRVKGGETEGVLLQAKALR